MDNVTGNENISKLFAGKFCNLYNSVSFNEDELEVILNENACDVQVKCTNDIVNGISDKYTNIHKKNKNKNKFISEQNEMRQQ